MNRRSDPSAGCAPAVALGCGLYVLAGLLVGGLLSLIDAAFR